MKLQVRAGSAVAFVRAPAEPDWVDRWGDTLAAMVARRRAWRASIARTTVDRPDARRSSERAGHGSWLTVVSRA
jgi:hypothetical protein